MRTTPPARHLPSRHRRLVVNLFIVAFVLGSAVSLATQRDFWPFSHYPMFADVQLPRLVVWDVFGVLADSAGGEVSLAPSRRTWIVSGGRYQESLALLVERGDEREIQTFLVKLARTYTGAGAGDAPSLRAVRLYVTRWEAVPAERVPARQVSRDLLYEIALAPS